MRKGILIIEPDPSEREPLRSLLSNDYVVTFAANAAEALEITATTPFVIVVFFMGRAGSGSLSELNSLKLQMSSNSLIIAITSYNDLEIEKSIAAIGVFYHLLKPYAEKDLIDLVGAAFLEWDRKFVLSSIVVNKHE